MASFDSYATLQSTIADWLNRTDLTTRIVDFIALAEDDLDADPELIDERQATLTLSVSPANLPTDCRELTDLYFDDDGFRYPFDIVAPELLALRKGAYATTGRPRWGAVLANGTQLATAPAPDQSYTAQVTYATKLTRLSTTTTMNWMLQNHAGLYLYGALLHSAPFLKDDPRLQTWQMQYDKALKLARDQIRRRKYGANTIIIRPRRAIG